MGYGSYRASDWQKLKTSRNLGTANNVSQTFRNNKISDKLDSRYIGIRESFDSVDSPNSTPVILGFDVTGSMGFLANEIATNTLNNTITRIINEQVVEDPHIMCAAFTGNNNPMQITQFEADIRVVEQLLDFVIGGGNMYSFDNLLWYFADKHTSIDRYNKRGKKGILIGIGDEICGNESNILTSLNIKNVFNDDTTNNYGFRDIFNSVSEKYEVVHIVIGPEYRLDKKHPRNSYDGWNEAIPGRVAKINETDVNYLTDVIIAVIKLLEGTSKNDIIKALPLTGKVRTVVKNAIEDMKI